MHKIMALDIGTKRIGIALSDFLHMLANGHSYIARVPENAAVAKINEIAKENKVEEIVIGVPINMDGSKGFQADDCINFSKNFNNFKIIYEDERLTSDTAEENLRERKINYRKDKGLVDVESARLILEQYLSKIK